MRFRLRRNSCVLGLSFLAGFSFAAGCKVDDVNGGSSDPFTISGQVREAGSGIPLKDAFVSIATVPTTDPVWTAEQGVFRFDLVAPGDHRIKAEKVGYQSVEVVVQSPINGISSVSILLEKKSITIPSVKPMSSGPVRIVDKRLEVDFDRDGQYVPFTVKGAAFSPAPIGGWELITDAVYDRCVEYLVPLRANTVRTYSGVSKYFLRKAAENNIRVIVGYWVPLEYDLSQPAIRATVKEGFQRMVMELKDSPGVLMWNLGNEQNYSTFPNNGNTEHWYSLVQELAVAAYEVEDSLYHPVCASNGGVFNIGSITKKADDATLSYMDLWASNMYDVNLANVISTYKTRSQKPIVVTEFGIDALDNRTKLEYEDVQADFDSTNWSQIVSHSDVCIGGTVFEFTDEWWKAGDPWNHDDGGYPTGAHPDGYSNEEWWGLIAVTPGSPGMDTWRPRKAYYMFQRNW